MVEYLLVIVSAVMVGFAAFAAAFSWDIYKRYRMLSGGIWMPLAFTLLVLQRISILAIDAELFPYDVLRIFNTVTFLLFSICLLYGLWRIKGEADELLRTDRQAMKAIIAFEKRRRQKGKALARESGQGRTGKRRKG